MAALGLRGDRRGRGPCASGSQPPVSTTVKRRPGPLRVVGDPVAGHARHVLDHRLAAAEDAVDQGRLADVRPADDGQNRQVDKQLVLGVGGVGELGPVAGVVARHRRLPHFLLGRVAATCAAGGGADPVGAAATVRRGRPRAAGSTTGAPTITRTGGRRGRRAPAAQLGGAVAGGRQRRDPHRGAGRGRGPLGVAAAARPPHRAPSAQRVPAGDRPDRPGGRPPASGVGSPVTGSSASYACGVSGAAPPRRVPWTIPRSVARSTSRCITSVTPSAVVSTCTASSAGRSGLCFRVLS